ncbi:hypothetical protein MKZ38_005822 [Zalerion maritima]|uniref:Uncharacterized protein n=1 Tax=Zalerion maritima TaxID=339359 RepID=A0AAD5S3T1_9PEZI|nr:hypothetical protein MKZ38_005822 [Zalerion maritima]
MGATDDMAAIAIIATATSDPPTNSDSDSTRTTIRNIETPYSSSHRTVIHNTANIHHDAEAGEPRNPSSWPIDLKPANIHNTPSTHSASKAGQTTATTNTEDPDSNTSTTTTASPTPSFAIRATPRSTKSTPQKSGGGGGGGGGGSNDSSISATTSVFPDAGTLPVDSTWTQVVSIGDATAGADGSFGSIFTKPAEPTTSGATDTADTKTEDGEAKTTLISSTITVVPSAASTT